MLYVGAGASADYIVTGEWSKKALKEARKVGATRVAATTEEGNFRRVPKQGEREETLVNLVATKALP